MQLEISRAEFVRLAAEPFPAVAAEILDEAVGGPIYSQIYCLTEYANHCLLNNQLSDFKRTIDFVQQIIEKVDSVTENAHYLDFLGCLRMIGNAPVYQAAQTCLEAEYLAFWVEVQARYFGENSASWPLH